MTKTLHTQHGTNINIITAGNYLCPASGHSHRSSLVFHCWTLDMPAVLDRHRCPSPHLHQAPHQTSELSFPCQMSLQNTPLNPSRHQYFPTIVPVATARMPERIVTRTPVIIHTQNTTRKVPILIHCYTKYTRNMVFVQLLLKTLTHQQCGASYFYE